MHWEAILCLEYYCHWRILLGVCVKCSPLPDVMIVTAGRHMFNKPHSVQIVQVAEEEKLGKWFSSRLYEKKIIYIYSAWSEVKWNGILYNLIFFFVYACTQIEYVMDESCCVSSNFHVSFSKSLGGYLWIFER